MLASPAFYSCMFCRLCCTVSASSRLVTHRGQYRGHKLLHSFTSSKRLDLHSQLQRLLPVPVVGRKFLTSLLCSASPPKTVHDIVRRVQKSECACGIHHHNKHDASMLISDGSSVMTCCSRRCHNHLCTERRRGWAECEQSEHKGGHAPAGRQSRLAVRGPEGCAAAPGVQRHHPVNFNMPWCGRALCCGYAEAK